MSKFIVFVFSLFLAVTVFAGNSVTDGSVSDSHVSAFAINSGKIFEPSKEDFKKNSKAISAQQKAYIEAKEAGDYFKAHANTLWHFQDAWLFNNEAFGILSRNWDDIDSLNYAFDLLQLAEDSLAKAEDAGHHIEQVEACQEKVTKNKKAVLDRIAVLKSKVARKSKSANAKE
jgi:hypothetical protein